jgi:hypothetical protein
LELFKSRDVLQARKHMNAMIGYGKLTCIQVRFYTRSQVSTTHQIREELTCSAANIKHLTVGLFAMNDTVFFSDSPSTYEVVQFVLHTSFRVGMRDIRRVVVVLA